MRTSRERILSHLKRHPASSVERLSQELDLAPMTIRQHLTKMEAEGLVSAERERRPTGRPAHVYDLTPAGHETFPKAYDRLAGLLWAELHCDDPAPAPPTTDLPTRLAARAALPHLSTLDALPSADRLCEAAAILNQESGFVELVETGDGVELYDYNCLYRSLAEDNDDLCRFHTAYAERLLGVPVDLVETRSDGANACCFRVQADHPARGEAPA